MPLNPERNTNVRKPTRRLLTGLIHCGTCGASMLSRPRDDHTKRYVCAGRRAGHQLAIVADAADAVVARRVLFLLGTDDVRRWLCDGVGAGATDAGLGQALADLGSAQSRLRALDDDYYVHGVMPERRYRSVKAKLEREIDRLRHLVDVATKQRVVLDPDPHAYWASAGIVQQRELVRLLVERVTIVPARRGVPRFDPSRVDIELKHRDRPPSNSEGRGRDTISAELLASYGPSCAGARHGRNGIE